MQCGCRGGGCGTRRRKRCKRLGAVVAWRCGKLVSGCSAVGCCCCCSLLRVQMTAAEAAAILATPACSSRHGLHCAAPCCLPGPTARLLPSACFLHSCQQRASMLPPDATQAKSGSPHQWGCSSRPLAGPPPQGSTAQLAGRANAYSRRRSGTSPALYCCCCRRPLES